MTNQQLVPYLSNDDLYRHVEKVLLKYRIGIDNASNNSNRNVIDPFFSLFESAYNKVALDEWLETIEHTRKSGKTLSNAIGTFHEDILGSVSGWQKLDVGNVIDLVNESKKIIADIKNKWNTTKGNHKTNVYDDIKDQLELVFDGYTGYYVEIVPKNPPYNEPFTPSDNKVGKKIKDAQKTSNMELADKLKLHHKRPKNEKIRRIDGKSFYHLATGYENAIELLYNSLPLVISDITDIDMDYENQTLFRDLFTKAYK